MSPCKVHTIDSRLWISRLVVALLDDLDIDQETFFAAGDCGWQSSNNMAFPRDDVYHADSDADDEFERSVMASPTQAATDSESESEIHSNEHTPTTFGPAENGILPKTIVTGWNSDECAHFIATLNLHQYCEAFIGKECATGTLKHMS